MADRQAHEGTGMRELITFWIGEQEFCVDIIAVREIRGYAAATPLPHAPPYVTGVINLRGTVLPIIDLGFRMGFDRIKPTPRSVIVVVKIHNQLVGLLVDAVSDIMTVNDDMLQPAPDMGGELSRTFVRGVMALDGRMISLIAVDNIPPQRLDLAA